MLSLKLLSPVISLPSYVVSIFHTFITSSLFNILTVLALYLLLLLLRHCYHPLKITHCSFRYASPGLWNQLPLPHSDTSSSVSNSPIPSPITSVSFATLLIDNYVCLSLAAWNLPVSQILPPIFLLLPPDCLHRLSPGPFFWATWFLGRLFLSRPNKVGLRCPSVHMYVHPSTKR